jgi:hypothetical protein
VATRTVGAGSGWPARWRWKAGAGSGAGGLMCDDVEIAAAHGWEGGQSSAQGKKGGSEYQMIWEGED